MAAKFYAVKKGRKTGIFRTWSEAEKQIKGYSGAIFKSFLSKEEAEMFLGEGVSAERNEKTKENVIEAYVDGSFDRRKGVYGSGVVLIKNGQIVHQISRPGKDPRYLTSYQIAGEVFACLGAIKWAKTQDFTTIIIYFDYEGIEKWATGMWSANKPISIDYKKYYQDISIGMQVIFKKVKAHAGVKYNELADSLAKKATEMG